MNSIIKKSVPFIFVLSSVAVAAGLISKEAVNQKVATLVAPLVDANTKFELKFTDLNVDTVRALDFGVGGFISKKGSANEMTLSVDKMAYHYGDGTNPTLDVKVNLATDMIKAFGPSLVNELGAELDSTVKDFAKSVADKKYGDALSVDAKLVELIKDEKGNVLSVKVHVEGAVDFSKLPASIKEEDVEAKAMSADISANLQGLKVSVKLVMNPKNKGFSQGEPGLKEFIERLLNDDKETYSSIQSMAAIINQIANAIVNTDSSAQ